MSTNDEDDVWDDALLIKAYDKAVFHAHNEVLKKLQSSSKGKDLAKRKTKVKWDVGDHCRCEYSEDHNYYEADIIDIFEDLGVCVVKYVGYENEEKVPLCKLQPSKGEVERNLQIRQALDENVIDDSTLIGKDSKSGARHWSSKKKTGGKKANKNKEIRTPINETIYNAATIPTVSSMDMAGPPPPPPPHMFTNMGGDVSESEAMSAMLMAWYMSGYHTGYYQGLKSARRK